MKGGKFVISILTICLTAMLFACAPKKIGDSQTDENASENKMKVKMITPAKTEDIVVSNKSIFDFIESVKFVRGSAIEQKPASGISRAFRRTEFTEGNTFILSAILRLPVAEISGNPIAERLEWAKKNQDLSLPNCGSLCDKYNARILSFLRFIYWPFPAGLSKKKLNWGQNRSRNPFYFRTLLNSAKFLHAIFAKELEFEIKIVD